MSPTQVSGSPYVTNVNNMPSNNTEWSFGPRPFEITPPAPFTQAFQTSYNDQGTANTTPAAINVTQRSYSRTGDDFVIVEVDVSSPLPRSGVYIGMFADYDVSATAVTDRANFDTPTRTVYAYNGAAGGNRNYYGVSLIGRQQSGWNGSTTTTDAGLFTALSTNGTPQLANEDRRLTIGAGPFTLAPGVPQTVRFAYVAGTDLADLTANAAVAQGLFTVASDGAPSEAQGLSIRAAQPNPATLSTELAFTLDDAQDVRLSVYDVLGREVAVVAEGARGAGTHTATVDVRALPAGVYVARLVAGGGAVLSRFTVVR